MSAILVVDDMATIRGICRGTIRSLGFEQLEAADGEEALACLEARHADIALILLDVNMPRLDGFQVLERLRAHPAWHQLPVMMLTQVQDPAAILQAIRGGARSYLSKPFSPADLAARIVQCLGLAPTE